VLVPQPADEVDKILAAGDGPEIACHGRSVAYGRCVRLVTVAEFNPPDAARQLEEWRRRNADALAAIGPDEVIVDVGRSVEGGDFTRVRVAEHRAAAFSDSL
jgi:hypothetical protein